MKLHAFNSGLLEFFKRISIKGYQIQPEIYLRTLVEKIRTIKKINESIESSRIKEKARETDRAQREICAFET